MLGTNKVVLLLLSSIDLETFLLNKGTKDLPPHGWK